MSSSPDEPGPSGDEPASNGRLDSWKEIASYLRRSIRSAKRWEKDEELPVHRHHHDKRDTVYAYRSELDGWWQNRGAGLSDQNATEEIAPVSEEPAKEVSPPLKRSRTAALLAMGLFVVLLIAAAWISKRDSRIASERTLPFQARDWILVADFENRTGEKLFDGTLEYALARELSNSRYVNVVPRERIGDALRLMRKPLETRVDAVVGREVCLRDGEIRTLLTGRIEKLGTRYLVSVDLVDPKRSTRVIRFTEESAGMEDSLSAVRKISERVREKLGETLPPESSETPLVKVTTSNLRALQLFSRADSLMMTFDLNEIEHQAAAEELLRQAVAEDPNFASAYMHLAYAIANQKRPVKEFRPYAEAALHLSEGTTERERYFIHGSYYTLLGQPEKAIAAYEALVSLYPDDFWGTTNLAGSYYSKGRFRDAVALEVRRADLRPWDFRANYTAASDLAPLDRVRSRLYVERARALVSPAAMQDSNVAWLELFPAAEAWVDGNLAGALRVADGVAAKIDTLNSFARTQFALDTALFYLTLGRLEAAEKCYQKIPDPFLRQEQLARVAFFRNDRRAMKQHLEASEGTTYLSANTVILLARVGLLPEAARLLKRIETQPITIPGYLQIPRGELVLARGQVDRGISELEEGTRRVGEMGHLLTFLGSESLAKAWKQKGNLVRAVQVLEQASEKRSSAAFENSGWLWLRNQFQLARLYREVGREQDALKIESELQGLLALADPDHPILLELRRLRQS
jgi:tetratricopeptide (TPR) repeat protein